MAGQVFKLEEDEAAFQGVQRCHFASGQYQQLEGSKRVLSSIDYKGIVRIAEARESRIGSHAN